MTPITKTRLNVSDVIAGARLAWNTKRGDLTLSGVLAVVLTVATSLSHGGLLLGLVLIGGVLVNVGRIITEAATVIRDGRDLDAYLASVFADKLPPSWFTADSLIGWDGPEQKPETD